MREILVERLQNSFLFGFDDIAVYIFIGVAVGIIVISIFLKINYFSSFLIFVISLSISRATQIIVNGSDLVLNVFLFLSIFLCATPRFRNPTFVEGQLIVGNFFFLFCRVQLALIYLISGFDKITSEAWRTGEAVFSIINLDYFFNPLISIELSKTACLLIAWVTMLFELSFAFLIWVKKFRIWLLGIGIVFHLGIAVLLSLPDFGIVMILLYSLFIPYDKLFKQPTPITSGGN